VTDLTADQVAYCHEMANERRAVWAVHRDTRNAVIEECATNLASWYPENASTNAFCAALRSMKTSHFRC
jgi:hypothetical protein